MQHKKNRGFTLIELVVVIAILGILAAFVLPRLADLTEDAHRASVSATQGAMLSAVNLVQAQWVARGRPGAVDNLAGFGTGTLDTTALGWPAGTSDSNTDTPTAARCVEIWQALLINQAPTVATSAAGNPDYLATAPGNLCTYTYQRGGTAARNITYNAVNGEVRALNP